MKLIDALELLRKPAGEDAAELKVALACGITPLHLKTFLEAHLRLRMPGRRILVKTGVFGDLAGNLERTRQSDAEVLAVVVEWTDLDPRLGVRNLGGWRATGLDDVLSCAARAAARLQHLLAEKSALIPTCISLPTLPLPPMFPTTPAQAGSRELQLREIAVSLAVSLARTPNIKIVNSQFLDEVSPGETRYDIKSDVVTGFPYSTTHASAVAEATAELIQNRQPLKGLITDLDDTLWGGILGEDGIEGISWTMDGKTHMHGIYQQFLASLASAGVLIGVASKNDAAAVDLVFARDDLLLPKEDVFPVEAHWSRKSESVARILKGWNISADAVVFLDDSPMEAAEVKASYPEMECLVFPKNDYQAIWVLLKRLRHMFGKPALTEDDQIRLQSLRSAGEWHRRDESTGTSDDFLRSAAACVTIDPVRVDSSPRAFELVNKTNQFNLNGRRMTDSEWRTFLADPAAFVLIVSYRDKFGPLGKISVIMGRKQARKISVTSWVLSCRAFSRRIEHQCLKFLFESFEADEIVFDYQATLRNGPLQEFFTQLLSESPQPGLSLSRKQFAACVPPLFHQVEGAVNA